MKRLLVLAALAAVVCAGPAAAQTQLFDTHVHLHHGEASVREYEAQLRADSLRAAGYGAIRPRGIFAMSVASGARLPVDPRLARMLLEADRNGALREVAVIVAALSIQDVRERPADKQTQADQQHARFKAKDSSRFCAGSGL